MKTRHFVPLTRRQRVGSAFWSVIAILFGWSLFIYWWKRVLSFDAARDLFHSLLFIGVCCLVFVGITLLWISHNLRIAQRGRRGVSTRYHVATFEHDGIGRKVVLPKGTAAQHEPELTVDATAEEKVYSAKRRAAS